MKKSEQVQRQPFFWDASDMTFIHVPKLSRNGREDRVKERQSGRSKRQREWSTQPVGTRKKMHTEFWKGIEAFGVWRFGEKRPIELGSETQIQKRKKGKEECMQAPYAERQRNRRRKAQAKIKYSLMVDLG
jgi:hypothetical protein